MNNEQTTSAANSEAQTNNDNDPLTNSLYKYSITKRALKYIITLAPLLAVPYLYFIGRFYDWTYYGELGVPTGILANDMSDTLLTGFTYGVITPSITLMAFMGPWVILIVILFYLWIFYLLIPQIENKIKAIIEWPFVKLVTYFGKKKSQAYVNSLEKKAASAEITPKLWRVFELSFIYFILFLATTSAGNHSIKSAKKNASEFITKADKANCQKSHGRDCEKFATLTIKADATRKKPPKQSYPGLLSPPHQKNGLSINHLT